MEKYGIKIGYREFDSATNYIREVEYGIEEEGCYSESYLMVNPNDKRFDAKSVLVVISNGGATLFNDENDILYRTHDLDSTSLRYIGLNAARYIKNKFLKHL